MLIVISYSYRCEVKNYRRAALLEELGSCHLIPFFDHSSKSGDFAELDISAYKPIKKPATNQCNWFFAFIFLLLPANLYRHERDARASGGILKRIEAIADMPIDNQNQIFNVIDALIRDYNAKKAYA